MKDQLPLSDCIVVDTRAVHQAEPLVGSLEVLGAEVVHIPLIGISEPSDGGASMRAAVSNLDVYDWVVVTSTNGSDSLKASLVHFPPGGPLLAAIGSKTALSLSEGGFSVALVPTRSAAMSLLDEFPKLPECGGRVLVLRAPRRLTRGRLAGRCCSCLPECPTGSKPRITPRSSVCKYRCFYV